MQRWRTTIDRTRDRSSAAPPSAAAGVVLVAAAAALTFAASGAAAVADRFAGDPAPVAVYATITHAGETTTALATPAWAPAEPVAGHRAPPLRPPADTTRTADADAAGHDAAEPGTPWNQDSAQERAAE